MTAIKTDRELTILIAKALGGVVAWNENGHSIDGEPIDCVVVGSNHSDLAEALEEVVNESWPEEGTPDTDIIAWQNTCSRGFCYEEPYWVAIEREPRFSEAKAALEALLETGWKTSESQC